MHIKTRKLIDGEIGTSEGVVLATYLDSIKRTDAIDAFYVWVDSMTEAERRKRMVLLRDWLMDRYPELLALYRITQ